MTAGCLRPWCGVGGKLCIDCAHARHRAAHTSKAAVTPRITELTFFAGDQHDEDTYAVAVAWRGGETYAVKHRSMVWNGSEWLIEPIPSSRTDEFIKRTRFDFDTACDHARMLAARSFDA